LNASCSHTKHTHAPNYVRRWRRRCQLHTSATATQHTQCAMHKQTHTKKRALLYAPEDMPGERGRRTGTLGTQHAVGKSWADLSHTVLSTSANPAIRTTPRTPHRGARSHQGTRTNADAPRRTPFQRPPCGAQGCAAELAEQSSPSSILLPAAGASAREGEQCASSTTRQRLKTQLQRSPACKCRPTASRASGTQTSLCLPSLPRLKIVRF